MTISHGKNDSGPYDSVCFFIKHIPTKHEFIFFGDVEPDSVAAKPRNVTVWRAAAPKIPHALSAVFIECSYPAGRAEEALWGHLSPGHLVQELITLATEVVQARTSSERREMHRSRSRSGSSSRPRKRQKREALPSEALHGALTGLRVYVMHCKEQFCTERPISHVIGDQCRELLAPHKLGLELLTADQGMKIGALVRFYVVQVFLSFIPLGPVELSSLYSDATFCSDLKVRPVCIYYLLRSLINTPLFMTNCIPSRCSLIFSSRASRCTY